MFGACISWVVYIVLSKNLHQRLSEIAITAYQSLFGTAFLIPLALLEMHQWVPITLAAGLNLAYLAVFCSALSNFLYVYALSRAGPDCGEPVHQPHSGRRGPGRRGPPRRKPRVEPGRGRGRDPRRSAAGQPAAAGRIADRRLSTERRVTATRMIGPADQGARARAFAEYQEDPDRVEERLEHGGEK